MVVGYIAEPRSAGGSAHPSAGRAPPTYRSSRACCSWWSCWWWSTPRSRAAPLPGGVAAHPSPGVAPRPEPDGDDVREPRAAACGAAGRCHTRHAGWDYLLVRVSRLHPPCGGSGSSDGSSASMNTSGSRPRSGRAIAARRESHRRACGLSPRFVSDRPPPCGSVRAPPPVRVRCGSDSPGGRGLPRSSGWRPSRRGFGARPGHQLAGRRGNVCLLALGSACGVRATRDFAGASPKLRWCAGPPTATPPRVWRSRVKGSLTRPSRLHKPAIGRRFHLVGTQGTERRSAGAPHVHRLLCRRWDLGGRRLGVTDGD